MDTVTQITLAHAEVNEDEFKKLNLLGDFARRTYANEGLNGEQWQCLEFRSALTGDVSCNGLNNFYTGFQAHAWANHDTKKIIFAVAGTNDLLDLLSWPTSVTGKTYGQVEDVILASQKIAALVDGESALYAGYKVSVTGHSLGGELAQIAAATYGWDGVSFDGPGGGAVIDGAGYKTFVNKHGITPIGHTGSFADVNVDSDGVYGGSLVGIAGYDVPSVDKHYYTRSQHTSLLSQWHRDIAEGSWFNVGFFPGKLISGVLVHFLDFIRKDIIDGNLVAHAPVQQRIYLVDSQHQAAQSGDAIAEHDKRFVDIAPTATSPMHVDLQPINGIGQQLQEIEGNIFSHAWTLASNLMQLHLDGHDGMSSQPELPHLDSKDTQLLYGMVCEIKKIAA